MKKYHLLILSAVSGIIFTIGWPVNGFPAFLFTAFIPLFIIEQHIAENRQDFNKFSVFFYTYPAFFIWNFLTTYWVFNSTPVAILAWVFNSMFMSIVFNVFNGVRRNVYNQFQGYFLVVFFWIAFEFVHLNWKLTWPWLTLGNGFAIYPKWIQWYEYTGVLGGTFWVLAVNILLFKVIYKFISSKDKAVFNFRNLLLPLLLIIVPIFISYLMYFQYEEKQNPVGIVVTQPNVDPYSEQYSLPPAEVVSRNLKLADQMRDESTMFIIAPESAIQENIWEHNVQNSTTLNLLHDYIRENPNLKIIIGASTYTRIPDDTKIPGSARYHEAGKFYYDRHNTAFLVDTDATYQRHHKSKLTPGVEFMPSWGPLSFLEDMAIDLGGTVGSLGIDKEQIPFIINDTIVVAPLICYESGYGEFTGNFVKNGANIMVIITNDGWWGNTPGHKQHNSFTSLRAIETRRSIARSANTGISCFVNQRGDVYQSTKYWEPDVIQQQLNLNSDITFYVRMGDYFGRISGFLSVIFILLSIVFGIRNKKKLSS